ncbi:hypothetical protein P7C71_g3898, partial [Lecanoromycetidae sp. Uapishka_2]
MEKESAPDPFGILDMFKSVTLTVEMAEEEAARHETEANRSAHLRKEAMEMAATKAQATMARKEERRKRVGRCWGRGGRWCTMW